jgi:tetratricopeptide (TPR) repeat protein
MDNYIFKSYISNGDYNTERGQYEEAVNLYTKAIQIEPQNAEGFFKRAGAYGFIALTITERLSVFSGLSAHEINETGYEEALTAEKVIINAALSDYAETIKLAPPNHPYIFIAYANSAMNLAYLKQYEKATDAFTKAIQLEPYIDYSGVDENRRSQFKMQIEGTVAECIDWLQECRNEIENENTSQSS